MRLRPIFAALICLFALTVVSACGNKGELYRIPDEINDKDLEVLDDALDDLDAQSLESMELEGLDSLSQEELDKLKAKKPGN